MRSYSRAAQKKLSSEVRSLSARGENTKEKTEELFAMNHFHARMENFPREQFFQLKAQIDNAILGLDYDLRSGLNLCIKEIENNDIALLLPENANEKIQWQYRHALIIGCLWQWYQDHGQSEEGIIKSFGQIIYVILTSQHLAKEDEVLTFEDNNEHRTYLSLYQEAIEKNILNPEAGVSACINRMKEEKRIADEKHQAWVAIEKEKEQKNLQAKQQYENDLECLNEELVKLANLRDAIAVDGSANTTIMDAHSSITTFLSTLKDEVNKTMSYENASKLSDEMTKTVFNLRTAYSPHLTEEERKAHINAVYLHADNVIRLSDNTIGREKEIFLSKLFVVISAILFAAAIAALVAASSGSFLGIVAFATTKTIIGAKGAALIVPTGATVGCIIGGVFGTVFGGAGLVTSSLMLFAPDNRTTRKAEIASEAVKKGVENVVPLKAEVPLEDAPSASLSTRP